MAVARGEFIRLTGMLGAGLSLALSLPVRAQAAAGAGVFSPNAWLRIAPDGDITIVVSKSEMGQGVATGLATIVAEELDASMDRVRVEFAPAEARYNDPRYGSMLTGGSTSIADGWIPLRQAGATARAMLVAAAARRWQVDPATCATRPGSVFHDASKRSASYGSLAIAAAAQPLPAHVALKSAARFTLIGADRKRLDIPAKVNGRTQYGIDVRVPGMVYAAIARSPVFGGRLASFDDAKAKAVPGVLHVIEVSNGVAVVARNTHAAFAGKLALTVVWDEGPGAHVNTPALFAEAEQLAAAHRGERVVIERGHPDTHGGIVVEATYRGPFLAHATMEPMNTTADVQSDRCEVWSPTQVQTRALEAAARASGLPPDRCSIHTTYLGGGFGRRLEADYVSEAVEVSRAIRKPVKVMWTREDDIQHDFYRPMSVNVVRGVVAGGELAALSHQVVSPSWLRRWAPAFMKNGVDILDVTEVLDAPYAVPNFRVSYIDHERGIPVGSWRAPDANWNGFVTESFVDELAHAAGRDPLAFRLALLRKNPRAARVLELVAQSGAWGRKEAGSAQGIAVTFWAGSYAAMLVEVSMRGKLPHVRRVVTAVDCGTVINPDIVVQQAQGATNFGLSAALTGKITIRNGRVEQNNFYDYTVLHMADAPAIEVHIIPSSEPPTGIGEVCVPPIAPAVGNAVFALTGKRVRQLPFSDALG